MILCVFLFVRDVDIGAPSARSSPICNDRYRLARAPSRRFRALKISRTFSSDARIRRGIYLRRVNSYDNKDVKFYLRTTNRLSLTLLFFPPSLSRIFSNSNTFISKIERRLGKKRASKTNEYDFLAKAFRRSYFSSAIKTSVFDRA